MKMPTKGTLVTVDGYGTGVFVGGSNLHMGPDDATVFLKFEGTWNGQSLDEGYGAGIIEVELEDFKENRVHHEQLSDSETVNVSTEKRDEIFAERFEENT